ncbi:hypothetical protein BSL78_28369 [Apostichopus japonicus]|uniref:Uncharacterized protein n=1 Tax=Stichopus japonicus TaxID=307972 RepID=A0A2G8JGD8_STIJA|nr:hypothetical protein BSL78_28369 [Apostichopus japonicus]
MAHETGCLLVLDKMKTKPAASINADKKYNSLKQQKEFPLVTVKLEVDTEDEEELEEVVSLMRPDCSTEEEYITDEDGFTTKDDDGFIEETPKSIQLIQLQD